MGGGAAAAGHGVQRFQKRLHLCVLFAGPAACRKAFCRHTFQPPPAEQHRLFLLAAIEQLHLAALQSGSQALVISRGHVDARRGLEGYRAPLRCSARRPCHLRHPVFAGQQIAPRRRILWRKEVEAVDLGFRLPLEAAQGRRPQLIADHGKAAGRVFIVGRGALPKGGAQFFSRQRQQPLAIQGAAGKLPLVERVALPVVQGAKALGHDPLALPLVIQKAVFVPLDGSGGLPLVKLGVDALVLFGVQTAFAAVLALGKPALVDHPALFVIGFAGALWLAVGKLPFIGRLAVGMVAGTGARSHPCRKVPFVIQFPLLVELAFALIKPLDKRPFVDQQPFFVGFALPLAQPILESAFIGQAALFVVFLALALQHAFFQPALIQRQCLLLVRIDDHPAGPAADAVVFHIKAGGQKVAEHIGPHHKIQQQAQGDEPQGHPKQKGFG